MVIPVFNGADHLGETLDSVCAQVGGISEIVVVDDGCTDESPAIAASRPGVRVVRNTGKGLDQARRFGLAHTAAPLVAFLDHDDLWEQNHLRLLAEIMEAHPEASAAVTHPRAFPEHGLPQFDAPAVDIEMGDPWALFPGSFTLTVAGALIRREAIEFVGGWTASKGFETSGDLYMWLRLTEYGPLIVNRCATSSYRMRPRSMNREMRRERVLRYAQHIANAAEAAVDARLERLPSEGQQLERRRLVARAVRHLIVGMVGGIAHEVARGAALLEAGTADEPEERIRAAFDPMFWLIDGHAEHPGVDGDVWEYLVAAWPHSAHRTAPFRLRYTSLRALLRSALLRPTEAWRWTRLFESMRLREGFAGTLARQLVRTRADALRARSLILALVPDAVVWADAAAIPL